MGIGVFVLVLMVFQVTKKALGDEDGHGNNRNKNDDSSTEVTITPTLSPTIELTVTPTESSDFQTQSQLLAEPTTEPTAVPTTYPTYIPNENFPTPSPSAPVMSQPEIKLVPISGKAAISSPGQLRVTPKAGMGILEAIKEGIQSIGRGEVVTPAITPITVPTPQTTKKETDVLLNTITLKYQINGGQLALVGQDDQGGQVAIEEVDLRRTETAVLNRLEKRGVLLSLTSDNKLAVSNNGVTAVTDLPIMVDVETKSLMVSTGAGPKTVTVLPDKALSNILDLGVIASVNTQVIPKIEYLSGDLVYKFEGTKVYKMLGLYQVTVPTTIVVSAETGEVVSSDQPLITKVVRLISL